MCTYSYIYIYKVRLKAKIFLNSDSFLLYYIYIYICINSNKLQKKFISFFSLSFSHYLPYSTQTLLVYLIKQTKITLKAHSSYSVSIQQAMFQKWPLSRITMSACIWWSAAKSGHRVTSAIIIIIITVHRIPHSYLEPQNICCHSILFSMLFNHSITITTITHIYSSRLG